MVSEGTEEQFYCAEQAREAGDPLEGTATEAKVWLLLEYSAAWRKKATTDNDLPGGVQDFLNQQLSAIPGARLLFIRQPGAAHERLSFFVVRTDETAPQLFEYKLDTYEDLTVLDVASAAAGDAESQFRRESPLFLICGNGRRDKCCARFGLPAYEALREQQPQATWLSTHIGGHRYAPTVLFLPHSVNYGFLDPAQMGAAAEALLNGRLYDLDNYRGRTHYAPAVQAADAFLRRELNLLDLDALRLQDSQQVEEALWRVRFETAPGGETHDVLLQAEVSEEPLLVSCNTPAAKPAVRFRRVDQ